MEFHDNLELWTFFLGWFFARGPAQARVLEVGFFLGGQF